MWPRMADDGAGDSLCSVVLVLVFFFFLISLISKQVAETVDSNILKAAKMVYCSQE